MSNSAWELSGVKLIVKAGLEHFRNRVVLVQGNPSLHQSFGGRSVFLNSIAQDLWSMCY